MAGDAWRNIGELEGTNDEISNWWYHGDTSGRSQPIFIFSFTQGDAEGVEEGKGMSVD